MIISFGEFLPEKEVTMSVEIHARRTGESFMFRIWNKAKKKYECSEMSISQLRAHLLLEITQQFECDFQEQIARAQETGTSAVAHSRRLDCWSKEAGDGSEVSTKSEVNEPCFHRWSEPQSIHI